MQEHLPKIIQDVGFDFDWDEKKVWALDLPMVEMPIDALTWHFSIPFLNADGVAYTLTPQEVMDNPDQYSDEYVRTMNANMAFPIDIMKNKGRWLILDGLHRLMKAHIKGQDMVNVRIVPRGKIGEIS